VTSQRSSEILRDWWRSQPNKFWPVVIIALVVIGDLIVVLAVIEYIAQRWQAGLFLEAPWFWILFGIVGLIGVGVVLLLLPKALAESCVIAASKREIMDE
jgi:nucleoside recognition membrane protein YjiH